MSKELTAVIVDDEAHCQTALSGLLARHHPDIKLLGIASTLTEGVEAVSRLRPEILFLDVEIGDRTGFELLQALGPGHPHVLFTTAHEGYALKAIRFSAMDFLLKPIDSDELAAAVAKAKAATKRAPEPMRVLSLLSNLLRLKDGQLSVPTDAGVVAFDVKEVFYFDHDGESVRIHASGKDPLSLTCNLKDCEDLMAEHGFVRVLRTVLVNTAHVREHLGNTITMSDGASFAVDLRKQGDLEMARKK
jgi:two-component system, LytTR family, response regulator